MPSVQQTAALRGLRPVANAFGACGRARRTAAASAGRAAVDELPDDPVHARAARASLTGRARIDRSASLSLKK